MEHNPLNKLILATACVTLIAATAQTTPSQPWQAELAGARQKMAEHKFKDAEKSLKSALKQSQDRCRECFMALAATEWNLGDTNSTFHNLDKALSLSATNDEKAEIHTIKGNFYSASMTRPS